MLKNIFLHFKKICIHKWWVFYYSCKIGMYWRGFIHDLSKFSPIEFIESAKYYQGNSSPINAAKADKGYSRAWQHHKGCNPHHYEYWVDKLDLGGSPIKMPRKYVLELCCDWLGAAKAYDSKNFSYYNEYQWVKNKLITAKIHPDTRKFILEIFLNTSIQGDFSKDVIPDEYYC